MHKIVAVTTVLALLIAMPFANAIAADSTTSQPRTTPESKVSPTRPQANVLTAFDCPVNKKTCSCTGERDCGEMGRMKVCKAGTFKPNSKGTGGTCNRKAL